MLETGFGRRLVEWSNYFFNVMHADRPSSPTPVLNKQKLLSYTYLWIKLGNYGSKEWEYSESSAENGLELKN